MLKPDRVIVLGAGGSGKSTLASQLSETFGLPYTPTDDIYWRTDWTPTPEAEVTAWIDATTSSPRWILDGNFDAQRDILWARAELAIWLDLSWPTTVWSVTRRNLAWWFSGKTIWGGVRMTLSKAFDGISHSARSHGWKRKTYPAALAAFPNLTVVRIRSRRTLAAWKSNLSNDHGRTSE